jgi:hypothetical protein
MATQAAIERSSYRDAIDVPGVSAKGDDQTNDDTGHITVGPP